jgi:hypothetical protein
MLRRNVRRVLFSSLLCMLAHMNSMAQHGDRRMTIVIVCARYEMRHIAARRATCCRIENHVAMRRETRPATP